MSALASQADLAPGGAEPWEIPPAVRCPACGESDCVGQCEALKRAEPVFDDEPATPETDLVLRWQFKEEALPKRLVNTAMATAFQPEEAFGHRADLRLLPAFTFAFFCETLGVFSTAAFWWSLAELASPSFYLFFKFQEGFVPFVLFSIVAVTIVLFAMHLAWGLMMEPARRPGRPADWRGAIAFGCYSCGWDLLTSPAGLLLVSLFESPGVAFQSLKVAARVPRLASDAHYNLRIEATEEGRKQTGRRAVIFFGLSLLFGTVGYIGLLIWWIFFY